MCIEYRFSKRSFNGNEQIDINPQMKCFTKKKQSWLLYSLVRVASAPNISILIYIFESLVKNMKNINNNKVLQYKQQQW